MPDAVVLQSPPAVEAASPLEATGGRVLVSSLGQSWQTSDWTWTSTNVVTASEPITWPFCPSVTTTGTTSVTITIDATWTEGDWITDDGRYVPADFTTTYWRIMPVGTNEVPTHNAPPVDPRAEVAARLRRRLERSRRKSEAERVEARALELLERCLGQDAVREWRRFRCVRVQGSLGGLYEVGPQDGRWQGQVVQLRPDGGCLTRWCCHATMRELPVLDQVVSLAMTILADEAGFQRTANNHGPGTLEFDRRVQRRRVFRPQPLQVIAA